MEVNDKVKELEDELKLLKAEIRNVLLDIREVVLERKNPLGEDHESAHLTLDLNTTARAMAAEAAAGEAMRANDEVAESEPQEGHRDETEAPDGDDEAAVPPHEASPDSASDPASDLQETDAPTVAAASEPGAASQTPAEVPVEPGSPAATATKELDVPSDDTDIPEMFMADLAPLSGDGSLAEWVTSAIDNVGVDDLRRVIAMFRLWGNVPPNISRALAHLQELLASSDEPRPSWLKVLQDLDRLASL